MNTQIYDEAAEWFIELQTEEPSADMRERFAAWLDNSPQHVRAFLEVTSLWEEASGVHKRRPVDIDALIDAARTERNLYQLGSGGDVAAGSSRGPWAELSGPRSRWRVRALAASIIVLGLSATTAWYWVNHLRGVHSTDVGEQRTLALSDGTTVELNARTRIRERFTEGERAVDLLEGQALFRVAKDADRPFVVRSDSAVVRAIGTQFDVHRRATGTTVTVLEGRVAVVPIVNGAQASAVDVREQNPVVASERMATQGRSGELRTPLVSGEVLLGAGDQLNLREGTRSAVPERADVQVATAWTQQRLVFEFTNLTDAADEFNRFNTKKLVVEPQGLEDFKVGGTFEALDPRSLERFVRFLRDQGLTVVESRDSVRISKNR